MKNKTAITILLTAIAFFSLSAIAYSQGPNNLSGPCEGRKGSSSIELLAGDIFNRPCEGRATIFEKNVSFRKNNADTSQYGYTFDSISDYDGSGATTNFSTQFNLDSAAPPLVYRNFLATFKITTPAYIAAGVGMTAYLEKTGSGDAHDLQAIRGSTVVTAGRVGSGIYGIIGSVRVYGGGVHGDIADLRVGDSTLSDTNARSYSGIWITRPTMSNSTFTGPITALRVDSALRTPAFTISQTGQIRIVNPTTPVNSAAPCQTGEIVWDPEYVYVCVANDSWKRTALVSW